MGYKRKARAYRGRRRTKRLRVYGRRRLFSRKGIRPVTVVRTFRSTYWQPATATTGDFWKYWTQSVSAIPNWSEYAALFEQYRVNWMKLTFRPRFNNFSGDNTTDTTLPGVTNQHGTELHVIIDPKSQTTPSGTYTSANLNTFLENGKVRTYRGLRPIHVKVKYPCVLDDINAGTGFSWKKTPWLSTQFASNIQHRGVHTFAADSNMSGTFGNAFDVFYTISVTFKGMN